MCPDLSQIPDLELALRLAAHVLLRDIRPLVIELFASRKSDLDLDSGISEIDLKRNNREALLGRFLLKFQNLIFMHEKFLDAERIAVENISLFIRADMHSLDKISPSLNPT